VVTLEIVIDKTKQENVKLVASGDGELVRVEHMLSAISVLAITINKTWKMSVEEIAAELLTRLIDEKEVVVHSMRTVGEAELN